MKSEEIHYSCKDETMVGYAAYPDRDLAPLISFSISATSLSVIGEYVII